jgi:hypothetical protein
MKIKIYYLVLSIILLFLSCKINVNGVKSNYTKSKSEKETFFLLEQEYGSICEISDTNKEKHVYIANGKNLNECLKKKENVIVYIWEPHCKSKVCYPLNYIELKCDENKAELYVIAEYYNTKLMLAENDLKSLIIGVDTKYYGTNITSKYLSKFIYDLTGENKTNGRYLKFQKGKFVNSFKDLNLATN